MARFKISSKEAKLNEMGLGRGSFKKVVTKFED